LVLIRRVSKVIVGDWQYLNKPQPKLSNLGTKTNVLPDTVFIKVADKEAAVVVMIRSAFSVTLF
jgi:gamma-glutamyltranspeptidase